MTDENGNTQAPPNKVPFSTLAAAMLAGLIVMSIVFFVYSPLDRWITFLVLGALWVSDFIALAVMYSLYQKTENPKTGGLRWSGFGEQRPDFGSEPPSRRR